MIPGRKEVIIGENTFFIKRFPPFMALEILGDLQKQLAGHFLSVMNGAPSKDDEEKKTAMAEAMRLLSQSIDGKTLRIMAERLLDKDYISVSIGGEDVKKLDQLTASMALESVADIFQLCWEVIQHNYSEVLARIGNPTGPAPSLMGAWSGNSGQNSKTN